MTSLVVGGVGVVVSDGVGVVSTSAGRVTGGGPVLGRTTPPTVVPWPPESCEPVAHSSPVINTMPSTKASTPPAASGVHFGAFACRR